MDRGDPGAGHDGAFALIEEADIVVGKVRPGPADRRLRRQIESGALQLAGDRQIVVVADHHGAKVQIADHIEAFFRFGVVADDIAEGNVLVDTQTAAFIQDHAQRVGVGVNVAQNCNLSHS